jgi:hypothetical protein
MNDTFKEWNPVLQRVAESHPAFLRQAGDVKICAIHRYSASEGASADISVVFLKARSFILDLEIR